MTPALGEKSVAVVFGTRPEIVKLAGVVAELGRAARCVHTGQHWDAALSASFLDSLGLGEPDVHLEVGGLRRGEQVGEATTAITRLLAADRPAAVVVQGDTNSALAGALAANAEEVALVHVEAGLRSFDRAMPEEHNRVLVDHLADRCCAPTHTSAANLAAEAIPAERIVVTGNTVVEAVRALLPPPPARARLLARFDLEPSRFALATFHRPENVDGPALAVILAELGRLPVPVVLPLHPRTRASAVRQGLEDLLRPLRIVEPLDYATFLGLAAESGLLVTDSGGVQEEVSLLGRPALVVRASTERPETLGTFTELVSPGPAISSTATAWLDDLPALHRRLAGLPSPYGDGSASRRSVAALLDLLGAAEADSPQASAAT